MNTEQDSGGLANQDTTAAADDVVTYRCPDVHDGRHIWQLVKDTGVLDLNSVYCYLVLCEHFRDTCIVAEMDDRIVGFVTGYLLPGDTSTLFVWQVGADAAVRGRGIAKSMLLELLDSEACCNVKKIHTTISPSNKASLALFNSLAEHLQAGFTRQDYFGEGLFPGNGHEQEDLIVVGPFRSN